MGVGITGISILSTLASGSSRSLVSKWNHKIFNIEHSKVKSTPLK